MKLRSVALLALAIPTVLLSQERPRPEIGFRSGIVRRSSTFGSSTFTTTFVAIPDGSNGSGTAFHYLFFASPRVGLEPQLGFARSSDDTGHDQFLGLGFQASYFLAPTVDRAPYAFGVWKTMRTSYSSGSSSGSSSSNGLGVGIGFRRVIRNVISTRYEASYIKWSGDFDATDLSLHFSLGVIIR